MGEIFGMGIPMICNSNVGDVEQIVTENNCGIMIDDLNEASYLQAVSKIDSLSRVYSKTHYYNASEKVFSLEKGIINFTDVYKKILGE